LVGAAVRVRGTPAASFNRRNQVMVTVLMYVPRQEDLVIDQLPGTAILQAPFIPLGGIARYRRQSRIEPRIRVKGIVTCQRGDDIFLQDESGGLQLKCYQTNILAHGEIVEAIGFPVVEHAFPVLQDATLTRTREFQEPKIDRTSTVPGSFKGFH